MSLLGRDLLKGYLLILTTAVGFIAALYSIGTWPSLILLALALAGFVVYVLLPSIRSSACRQKFDEGLCEIMPIEGPTRRKAREVMPSLIETRPECVNTDLVFEALSFGASVDAKGNYLGNYRARGYCLPSRYSSERLRVLLGSGSWNDRSLTATDNLKGSTLKVLPVPTRRADHAEIVRADIMFAQALRESAKFDVSWSFVLPGACDTKGIDSDFFLLWPFPRICGEVTVDLNLAFSTDVVNVFSVSGDCRIGPFMHPRVEIDRGEDSSRCRIAMDEPKGERALILVWHASGDGSASTSSPPHLEQRG
jgi:hypothetical protein